MSWKKQYISRKQHCSLNGENLSITQQFLKIEIMLEVNLEIQFLCELSFSM